MKQPAAADLVRPIRNFMMAFMSKEAEPERDSASVQAFYRSIEAAFRAHPLWQAASPDELECSGEALEKYLMTKLFPRAFAPEEEEVERDRRLTTRIAALQTFLQPRHLDVPDSLLNDASLLLAEKDLQKLGSFKAPRDKLVCVLNCCRVINNILLNASITAAAAAAAATGAGAGEAGGKGGKPPGADDFLPVLIYVVVKPGFSLGRSQVPHTYPCSPSPFFFTLPHLLFAPPSHLFPSLLPLTRPCPPSPLSSCTLLLSSSNTPLFLPFPPTPPFHSPIPPPQANPPQLLSSILYIQRYRHSDRLVSEAAYFFTNLASAATFLESLSAAQLSLSDQEFQRLLEAGYKATGVGGEGGEGGEGGGKGSGGEGGGRGEGGGGGSGEEIGSGGKEGRVAGGAEAAGAAGDSTAAGAAAAPSPSSSAAGSSSSAAGSSSSGSKEQRERETERVVAVSEISRDKGVLRELVRADASGELARSFRFLYASAADLSIADVSDLLAEYKDLALRHYALSRVVHGAGVSLPLSFPSNPARPTTASASIEEAEQGEGAAVAAAAREGEGEEAFREDAIDRETSGGEGGASGAAGAAEEGSGRREGAGE
ncbi:unnamed protein product [Closterium sp. Naga37s-1]|nr:unnamed protein product [Closterium sp. Naga37s-1]